MLASCAKHRQQAIETICKGVNSTGRACSTAVGFSGKCSDCMKEIEQNELETTREMDITSLESKENSFSW